MTTKSYLNAIRPTKVTILKHLLLSLWIKCEREEEKLANPASPYYLGVLSNGHTDSEVPFADL